MIDSKTKEIKIKLLGFGQNPENFFFVKLLRKKYNIVLSETPDYVFYTPFDSEHHQYDCVRIFFTGENVIPNFNICDYAISFQHLFFEDRHLRCPLWRLYEDALTEGLKKGFDWTDKQLLNRDFCACVISNSAQTDGKRAEFFNILSKYKQIASGGRWQNNVGGPVPDKCTFQQKYKFTLAFENTYSSGYTTEKLLEGFASHTVPIYYGDPRVTDDFNPKSFINAADFNNLEDLSDYVQKVDSDDSLYLSYMREPIFLNNQLPEKYTEDSLLKFFDNIFKGTPTEAKRLFYKKPYADIDYQRVKTRDIKNMLKYKVQTKIKHLFDLK